MAKTKSITETGPKALKGVRNPDLYSSQSLGLSDIELQSINDNLARSIHANYNAAHGHLGYQGLNDQSLYTPQITPELEYGSSTYDEGLMLDPTQQDIDNQRAENQSALTQAAAGIAKGAILAGTTFIDGTVGLLYGLGQGISNMVDGNKETSFSQGLWDNPITALMGQINDAAEKELVNYRTEEQINGPWYDPENLTSANFIFDTVVKNMGFTIGAAYSGGVYTKAISWGAKALGMARLGKATAATIEAGQKAMQQATATRNTKALVGSFFSAHAEAVQEAYNSSKDFVTTSTQSIDSRAAEQKNLAMQEFIEKGGSILADGSPNPASDPDLLTNLENKLQQIDQASDAAKSEITRQSKKVGTMDGILNIPILWLSNVAMFGKMYSGGWKAARTGEKTVTRATKEAMKEAEAAARAGDFSKLNKLNELVAKAEQTGYQGLSQAEKSMIEEAAPHLLGKKAGVAWAATKGPLREGNEEMMQGAASQAANYRYQNEVDRIFDSKLNLESAYKTRGLLESIYKGIKSQYGDIDNYEEAFVGAITGLLGSPTFGKSNNSTDQTYLGKSKWIGLSGGAITETRDYLRDRRDADKAAQHATEVLRRETLADDIKHLIAQAHFSDTMDRAVIHDDEKEYKDARTASIFEMISHLKRVDRLDLLQRAMKATTEFTDEDIAAIAKSVSKEVSATTPDVSNKIKQKDRVEKEIETMLESYEELYREAVDTGDSSKIDATDQMLRQKREELAQLETEIEKAKPVTVSPYIHKDGKTPFTTEEIKEDLQKRVDSFQKIINTITLAQDQIDEATSGTLTNEQLDTLTWYKVMMSDWNERADGITEHWKELITKLANDPKLVSAIESIKEVEDLLKEAGFDPSKADIQLGGRFANLKKLKNYNSILQQLQEAVAAGGINLAYLLTNTLKPESSEETIGDIISKQLELALDSDTSTSKDIKQAFMKSLNDLKSIGQGHRRYNELLDEYLKNPERIDQAHQNSINSAQAEHSRQSISNTANGINWNSPAGTIARYLKDNARKIQEAGGFEEFIKNLTPEQQKKAREAQKLVMGIDSLDSLIDQANLPDEHAQILRGILEDKIDEADTIKSLADAIKDSITEGEVEELIRKSVPEDKAEDLTLKEIEAAEKALAEFMDDISQKLVNAAEEAQKAMDAEQEKVSRLASQVSEDDDKLSKLVPQEEKLEAPEEGPLAAPDENSDDEAPEDPAETPAANPTSATAAKQANKRASISPQAGQSGFNRRRQVSQYYLHGEDKETLPKHYEEHPEDIPAGVDKEAFLKYIKAVHKKLVESGAYTYISGVNPNLRLKEGQEIRFTTDKKLNEDAGVPVILMVVTDEQGNDQIIGSLPTSLDFQAKQRGGTKTIGEVHPEDKALYDTLCSELLSQSKDNNTTAKADKPQSANDKKADPKAILTEAQTEKIDENSLSNLEVGDIVRYEVYNSRTGTSTPVFFKITSKEQKANGSYKAVAEGIYGGMVDGQAVRYISTSSSIGFTKVKLTQEELDKKLSASQSQSQESSTQDFKAMYDEALKSSDPNAPDYVLPTELQEEVDRLNTKYEKELEELESLLEEWSETRDDDLARKRSELIDKLQKQLPSQYVVTFGRVIRVKGTGYAEDLEDDLLSPQKENKVKYHVGSKLDLFLIHGAIVTRVDNEGNILDVISDKGLPLVLNGKKVHESLLSAYNAQKAKSENSNQNSTSTESNSVQSSITTKVEALRGGRPSFSSQNRSVSEVFGDAPVAITVISGNSRSSQAVKNPLDLAKSDNGQVYVYVTANTGVQIPLLCFSTPLKDLATNDWYIEQAVAAIQKLQDELSMGSAKKAILKWIPFTRDLHINVINKNGKKQFLFGWDRKANGKPAHTYVISAKEDGSISAKNALEFIKYVSGKKLTLPSGDKIYPTTNIDPNRLGDKEYMDNITRYLKTNVTSDSPRTIDDWFTYEPTEIQKKKQKPSRINPAVTPTGKQSSETVIETPTGQATVSSAGTVTNDGGIIIDDETIEALVASFEGGVEVGDTEKKSSSSVLDGAFGSDTSDIDEMPDTSKRRRRRKPKNGEAKFSLAPQESSWYTPEMQSIKDKAIADGTFMKAPNGNPTNLNERQWLQVRTKDFINWFGDWINNPNEASKVVDENGEPLVVYHHTDSNISIFDKNKTKDTLFYFTSDKTGENIYYPASNPYVTNPEYTNTPVFLNIKIPMEVFGGIDDGRRRVYRKGEYQKILDLRKRIISAEDKTEKNKLSKELSKLLLLTRSNPLLLNYRANEDVISFMNNNSSDGLITNWVDNEKFFVAVNPNQIKSATSNTGGFSTTNDDIRLLSSDSTQEQLSSSTQIEDDLEKLSSMFPKLAKEGRVVLVKGLIDAIDKNGNPRQAYGMFRNGVLYVSDQSPKGTAFHEAFHYIADTLLSDAEWETIFDEASKLWGNLPEIELEENLAEAFREFMNERQDHSVKGRLNNIFQKLKHIVLSIVGRENYLDNLFWSIYRNKMQNRTDNTSQDTFKQELLRYKTEQLKYSNLDQETKDYLKAREFSEENYEKLSVEQKEILLQCM